MQTFCSSYIFPPIDKYAGSPSRDPFYGIARLNPACYSATVVPAEKLEHGRIFLSNFKTKHSRPREKGLERRVQTDTGGCKKRHLQRRTDACLLLLEILKRATSTGFVARRRAMSLVVEKLNHHPE